MITAMPAARRGFAICSERDEAEIAVGAHVGDDAVDAYARIGFVDSDDVDIDTGT
jgi:hypothetical protein